MMKVLTILGILTAVATSGCSVFTRETTEYSLDVHNLFRSSTEDIAACYATALDENPEVRGKVTVHIRVAARTGRLEEATVDPAKTTAPAEVQRCVVDHLKRLKLNPPDTFDAAGDATWNFTAKQPTG